MRGDPVSRLRSRGLTGVMARGGGLRSGAEAAIIPFRSNESNAIPPTWACQGCDFGALRTQKSSRDTVLPCTRGREVATRLTNSTR